MCGIVGFLELSRHTGHNELQSTVMQMADAIRHRGPDDQGVWVDTTINIALGHRRLSILDLSPEGHQPMHSANGRYVVVFNGEIYNFRLIQKELENIGAAPVWRGHSDTEVMLGAISQWGVEASVKRFVGMFAFALWDKAERVLYLARDRLGEKPLYYGWMGDVFLFGSELKALRGHPAWRGEIDHDALALYMRHNYIPAPYSIYREICKLLPGTILALPTARMADKHAYKPVAYWSAKQVAEDGTAHPFIGTEAEAIERLDNLLRDSTRQKMVADVPLGAFLSGGVDSSTVVALMQAQSDRPVKTFTIGFHEGGYNEADHAKAVAQHLGTEHTEVYVTPQDALAVIPKLPILYDEPFSDSSQIPTFLVSQITRKFVTVSLSGDGGDELFCGYTRYDTGRNLWEKIRWLPQFLRQTMGKTCLSVPVEMLNAGFGWLAPALKKHGRGMVGDKLHKLAEILSANTPEEIYQGLVSHWKDPAALVLGACEPPTAITDRSQWADLPDFSQRMMYLDTVSYLPDDILVKVDRASMGVSLEARVPLLDHRIVEFAWQVPLSMKVRNGQGKWLLRQVLYKYVPERLIERPKMGFGIPIGEWLRKPLRDWAEELLAEKRLLKDGFLNPVLIREKWLEHLSGTRDWQYYLWDILMFQAWLEEQQNALRITV